MKIEYRDVSDEQIIEKTEHNIDYWINMLTDFNANEKKST